MPVRLLLPGPFNVANALVALACLDAAAVPPSVAAEGLARVAVPGRMQRIERGQPFLAVVDYAHKPAAVAALLDALRPQVAGRLLVVLGCRRRPRPGQAPADGRRRRRSGRAAGRHRRQPALRGSRGHPRGDAGGCPRRTPTAARCGRSATAREAIAAAVAAARPGDAVVVAGKGHETGQKIGDVTLPFDDAEELAAAIAATVTTTGERPSVGTPNPGRVPG